MIRQWFMIPTRIFLEIHDSRKLLMTRFNKWISQRLLCLVLRCFFWYSNFCFHPELYRFLDHCFSVSSFVLSRYRVFCYWTLSTSVTGESSGLSASNARIIIMAGSRGMLPRKKKHWNLDLRKRHILQSLDRTQLIHTYFVALFSETRYSWFPSRTDKDSWFPSFKNKDSWFLQVL